MVNAQNVSSDQLRRALQIKEQIESLEQELSNILGAPSIGAPSGFGIPRRRGRPPGSGRFLSPAARERIAAAQRARWAKHRGSSAQSSTAEASAGSNGRRRRMSPAARARIAEAARRRWAAYRATKGQ